MSAKHGRRLAELILAESERAGLGPGSRLPTERQLAVDLGVTRSGVRLALAALEAGVQGLRLNPGNLRKEAEIKQVAAEARDRGVPIRIGVNAGSLHPDLYKKYGGATPEALVESARNELALFEEVGSFLFLFPEGLTARRSSVIHTLQSDRPVVVTAPRAMAEFAHHAGFTRLIEAGVLSFVPEGADLRAIADQVGAVLFVDMAHVAGLVAAGCRV